MLNSNFAFGSFIVKHQRPSQPSDRKHLHGLLPSGRKPLLRFFASLRMTPGNQHDSPVCRAARAGVPVREYMRTPVLSDWQATGADRA